MWSCIKIQTSNPSLYHTSSFSDHRKAEEVATLEIDAKMWEHQEEGTERDLQAEAAA